MRAISWVHEAGFKPINGCSLEVREDEQDLPVRGKDMGPITEVQIARDKSHNFRGSAPSKVSCSCTFTFSGLAADCGWRIVWMPVARSDMTCRNLSPLLGDSSLLGSSLPGSSGGSPPSPPSPSSGSGLGGCSRLS